MPAKDRALAPTPILDLFSQASNASYLVTRRHGPGAYPYKSWSETAIDVEQVSDAVDVFDLDSPRVNSDSTSKTGEPRRTAPWKKASVSPDHSDGAVSTVSSIHPVDVRPPTALDSPGVMASLSKPVFATPSGRSLRQGLSGSRRQL